MKKSDDRTVARVVLLNLLALPDWVHCVAGAGLKGSASLH